MQKKYKDKDWLYQKYWGEGLTTIEIAKLCRVSKKTILNWMEHFKIKRKTPSEAHKKGRLIKNCKQCGKKFEAYPKRTKMFCSKKCARKYRVIEKNPVFKELYENRDLIYQKYVIEKLSSSQIGKLYGVNSSGILRLMKRHDIKRRSISEATKGHVPWNKGLKLPGLSLPLYEASFNELLFSYKYHAKRRNLEWDLNKEEFRNLTKQNCFFCGKAPNQGSHKNKGFNGIYVYNGLDRVDNKKGYLKENIVPCCSICNRAKSNRSYDEFISWIEKVNQFIKVKGEKK